MVIKGISLRFHMGQGDVSRPRPVRTQMRLEVGVPW